jgi:hypothetical protein
VRTEIRCATPRTDRLAALIGRARELWQAYQSAIVRTSEVAALVVDARADVMALGDAVAAQRRAQDAFALATYEAMQAGGGL